MPTYEYKCTLEKCKYEWEEILKIKDATITNCPKCKNKTAKRLISLSAFVLKGGGWSDSGYSNKWKKLSISFARKLIFVESDTNTIVDITVKMKVSVLTFLK